MAEPLTAAERMELGAGRPVWRSEEPDCHFCPCCYEEIQRYEATVQAVEAERDRLADLVAEWQALAEEFRQLAQRHSAEITAPLEPVVAAARAFVREPLLEATFVDLEDAVAALEAGEEQDG